MRFKDFSVVYLMSSLFWDVAWHRLVVDGWRGRETVKRMDK
jgi:hypothetical protein